MARRNYNADILADKQIPDDTRYITSLSLKKDTYSSIDKIMKNAPAFYPTKGRVVDEAVKFFIRNNTDLLEKVV